MKWLIVCLLALFMVTPAMAGEDPYIALVGNDIDADPFGFYLSPKYSQFLLDENFSGYPVVPSAESFYATNAVIQPEICDLAGTAGPGNEPPFIFRGNFNAKIPANNDGYFEWTVRLPKKPDGELNLCFQCGVVKPNAFNSWGFNAVENCAAESGEIIGAGECVRAATRAGKNPVKVVALPKVEAWAISGRLDAQGRPFPAYTPFRLTAFRNPGTYNPFVNAPSAQTAPDVLANNAAGQILDGISNGTRVLLKSCMDKCVVAKLPVTGQVNANDPAQTEHDLEQGDLIRVRLIVPDQNTVDIYCHQESFRVMGIGESVF